MSGHLSVNFSREGIRGDLDELKRLAEAQAEAERLAPLATDLSPIAEAADERGESLGDCEGCGRPAYHQAPFPFRPFLMCDECVVRFAKDVIRHEKKHAIKKMAIPKPRGKRGRRR